MVSSPRKCLGVEGKVCNQFLPSKENNPQCLCVACCGKICKYDDCCEECHDWSDDRCNHISDYMEKLPLQCERKRKQRAKASSSSFSGFLPSMPVPPGSAAVICGFRNDYRVAISVSSVHVVGYVCCSVCVCRSVRATSCCSFC